MPVACVLTSTLSVRACSEGLVVKTEHMVCSESWLQISENLVVMPRRAWDLNYFVYSLGQNLPANQGAKAMTPAVDIDC